VDKSQEKDVPILKEDQERINRFARLSNRIQLLTGKVEEKKKELENYKDACSSAEEFALMAEEGEFIRVLIGECYIEMDSEEAEAKLQMLQDELVAELDAHGEDEKAIQKEMAELKVLLYAKFGKTINLELDPED
jgi:prefoldin subunit 4